MNPDDPPPGFSIIEDGPNRFVLRDELEDNEAKVFDTYAGALDKAQELAVERAGSDA